MIIHSAIHDNNYNLYLIVYLRKHKFLWDYKFFFDQLTKRQIAVLAKSLLINRSKTILVCLEGRTHSLKYWRPYKFAKMIFGHMDLPNAFYYNPFFDEIAKPHSKKYDHSGKKGSELIEKVCFISSNYSKLKALQITEPDIYANLDVYGEFHSPIQIRDLDDRSGDSLVVCAKYMAALCIENNSEEGYFQGSALWALYALTPPILKSQRLWKNFLKQDFVIDFYEYKEMNYKKRLNAITSVQDRLYSGDQWLTNLSLEYLDFFKEAFDPSKEPDFSSIIKKSKDFRKHCIRV